ncbi:hypothetical protein ABEF91_007069 [Exophiala dermatitidis]
MGAVPIVLCAWLLYVTIRTILVYRTQVPGPWYSNVTSLVQKYYEFTRRRRLWIHHLHKVYGPVVRLNPNEVSFANLDGMKEIYQSGGSGYDKASFYDLFMQYNCRTMFSMLKRNDHARRKKIFAERYSMTNVLRPDVLDGIQVRAAKVLQKIKSSTDGCLDVYVTLHCYAVDCASHFLANPRGLNTLDDVNDFKMMQELSYHDTLRQKLMEQYCPPLDKIANIFRPAPWPLTKHFILERARDTQLNGTSLVHSLQAKSTELDTVQIAAECLDHLAAGIDTTGDGLCFLMHELSLPRSAKIQESLYEEIVQNPHVKATDLPYLDAIVMEGLRLFPPLPMSLPRSVPVGGSTISGYKLPGGTTVSCQAYSLHRLNPDIYPDPDAFIPERWLEKEKRVERNRLFFAFSAGGRGCIGKNLALVEMKTLLREIYGKFTTRLSPQFTADMSIDDQIIASRPKDQTCVLKFEERISSSSQ